jgi:hypothetical protein
MAEVLDVMPPRQKTVARVSISKVDPWLDGQTWHLTIPDDAAGEAELLAMRRALYRRGKQRGLDVTVLRKGDSLYVRAVPLALEAPPDA